MAGIYTESQFIPGDAIAFWSILISCEAFKCKDNGVAFVYKDRAIKAWCPSSFKTR
jgi:hypothetical protein